MSNEPLPRYATMIRDLPQAERPRKRLRRLGPSCLSNPELIAILMRTGVKGESVLNVSTHLLSRFGGLPGIARVTYSELCSLNPEGRAVIGSPRDVFNLLGAEMGYLDQEHLRVVLANPRLKKSIVTKKSNVHSTASLASYGGRRGNWSSSIGRFWIGRGASPLRA